MNQSEVAYKKSEYTNHTDSESLQSKRKLEKNYSNIQQNQEQYLSVNPSFKETKCCSTFLESQKSFVNQNSQIEQKYSLFSAQFKDINSQQNLGTIDNYTEMSRSRLGSQLNDEDNTSNIKQSSKINQASKITKKSFRSQSINCCTFGKFRIDGDDDDDDNQDFKTSLLNATRISKQNRAKLRKDLIQSNIIQDNSFHNSFQLKKENYDENASEEELILPCKGKSMLISINNSVLNQSRNQCQNNKDSAQQQLILNLIEKCCQDYDEQQQQQKFSKSQQLQFAIPSQIPSVNDQNSEQKIRRRSSSFTNQMQSQKLVNKEHSQQVSDEISKIENNQNKHDIMLATTQSLPSIIETKQFQQVAKETQLQEQHEYEQAHKFVEKLNHSRNVNEDETEYYDEDYYLSNQKDSQKHDIRFHKSFFNLETLNNNSKNRQQSSNFSLGRSREFTDNHLGFTEINHFTTEVPSCIRLSDKSLKHFDQEESNQPPSPSNFLKPKAIECSMNHLYVSSQTDQMRLSSAYDKQTIGGAISLQTFMQTKQNIFLQDWIKKRSSNILVGWQKRWLVLKNKKLQYFKTDTSASYQGCIDFSILTCSVQKVENKKGQIIELRIKVEDSNKTFRFQKQKLSSISLEKWAEAIQNQINYCTKYKLRPRHITQQREFWKKDRICLNEFESLADTGDLILFKGMTFGEKVVRNLINCEYNHIGLILRTNNDTNNLLILEATGDEGVGILSWKTFLQENWQELYHKISLRKLIAERTDEMLTNMESFIRYAIGKEYGVTLSKLFKKRSDSKSDLSQDPNRTFFCSELIATIYKICGLLPLDISSGHYWPSSFEGSRNLKLTNNASLSEEFIIDFEI